MYKQQDVTIVRRISYFLLFSLICSFLNISSAFAFSWHALWQDKKWHPVLGLGAGGSFSAHVGQSNAFPIQQPVAPVKKASR